LLRRIAAHHRQLDRRPVIVRAPFDRGKGCSHEVSRTMLYRGKEQTVANTASCPPDTQACIFWLRAAHTPSPS
jgi:hypothetical protein